MSLRLRHAALLGLFLGAGASACKSSFDEPCDKGTRDCECLPDDECVSGLSCEMGVCVESTGGETEADTGGDGDGDAMNFFGNPSFESWAGMTISVWEPNQATLTQETTMVAEGDSAVRFESTEYGSVGQNVSFSPPLGAGDCLMMRARGAYVEGDTDPPAALLSTTNEEGEDVLDGGMMLGWVTDGEYHELERLIEPTGTIVWADVFFNAPSNATTWLLDDASLVRVACP